MPPRLKERYKSEIVPELMREFSYRNIMQVPRVEKVTLNIGLGEAKENARAVETATADLATISGQKAVVTAKAAPVTVIKSAAATSRRRTE